MELGSRGAFAAVLLVGVAGTGLLVRLFHEVGYGTVGSAVWVLGYGGTVLLLWYGWLRPLDLSGRTSPPGNDAESEETPPGE